MLSINKQLMVGRECYDVHEAHSIKACRMGRFDDAVGGHDGVLFYIFPYLRCYASQESNKRELEYIIIRENLQVRGDYVVRTRFVSGWLSTLLASLL